MVLMAMCLGFTFEFGRMTGKVQESKKAMTRDAFWTELYAQHRARLSEQITWPESGPARAVPASFVAAAAASSESAAEREGGR
jgi:hypothetical protein